MIIMRLSVINSLRSEARRARRARDEVSENLLAALAFDILGNALSVTIVPRGKAGFFELFLNVTTKAPGLCN